MFQYRTSGNGLKTDFRAHIKIYLAGCGELVRLPEASRFKINV